MNEWFLLEEREKVLNWRSYWNPVNDMKPYFVECHSSSHTDSDPDKAFMEGILEYDHLKPWLEKPICNVKLDPLFATCISPNKHG